MTMSQISRPKRFPVTGVSSIFSLFILASLLLPGSCQATLPGDERNFDPELAFKAAATREKNIPSHDLGRFFLKEIMRDGDTPCLALILDMKTTKETFYLTGSFIGPFEIDRVMSESVILKEPESGDLFYLKINTRTMEKIKTISSDNEEISTDTASPAVTRTAESNETTAPADDFDPLGEFDSLNLTGKSQKTIQKKLRALRSGAYVRDESKNSESETVEGDAGKSPTKPGGGGDDVMDFNLD